MTSTHECSNSKVFLVKISEDEVNELLKAEVWRVLREYDQPLKILSCFIEADGYRGYQVTVTCREEKKNES